MSITVVTHPPLTRGAKTDTNTLIVLRRGRKTFGAEILDETLTNKTKEEKSAQTSVRDFM